MKKDFTISIYKELLSALSNSGYQFLTYHDFHSKTKSVDSIITMRHDVDARKENSFEFACIQFNLGIKGTYYFRTIPQSYDEQVIRSIAEMGHEIGYHYETMDTCKGNIDKAYDEFCRNLEKFRKLADITTICMHGSPLSKYDNRDIWKKYDYRKLGIIAEPYFDLDFNKTFYLTDTGRRWDGAQVSVRDKAMLSNDCANPEFLKLHFHSTSEIIKALKTNIFPHNVMMTFHPQRWTDNNTLWLKELLAQNIKNEVKKLLIKKS